MITWLNVSPGLRMRLSLSTTAGATQTQQIIPGAAVFGSKATARLR